MLQWFEKSAPIRVKFKAMIAATIALSIMSVAAAAAMSAHWISAPLGLAVVA